VTQKNLENIPQIVTLALHVTKTKLLEQDPEERLLVIDWAIHPTAEPTLEVDQALFNRSGLADPGGATDRKEIQLPQCGSLELAGYLPKTGRVQQNSVSRLSKRVSYKSITVEKHAGLGRVRSNGLFLLLFLLHRPN
jgi:hypothetical protein